MKIFAGFKFESRVDIGNDDDYVLRFRRGDSVRYAVWTSGSRHNILVPLTKSYAVVTHLGQETVIVNPSAAIAITTDPTYLQ